MKNILSTIFMFPLIFFTELIYCQIPKPNTQIHYTQVYFEIDFVDEANLYQLYIYTDSLKLNQVFTTTSALPAFQVDKLKWSQKYFWFIKAIGKNNNVEYQSPLYRFEIAEKIKSLNVNDTRVDIKTNKSNKHAGGYILMDYSRGIFDREGNQVWTLPKIDSLMNDRKQVRDLRLSVDNTITFLGGSVPIELDFEGNVLWNIPAPFIFNGDTISFHHDLKKMKNGHFMVLGQRKVCRKVLGEFTDEVLD